MNSASGQAALLVILSVASGGNSDYSWESMDVQCIPDGTSAIDQSASLSPRHCVMKAAASMASGLLVAQFNGQTQRCRFFRYKSLCGILVFGTSPDCLTFGRFPIKLGSINPKLTNLWLADDLSSFENLICQTDEDTNRFHLLNTIWASDGLKFDGSTSYMYLNKSSIDFSGGLTWLLKLKRTPKVQPILDFHVCSAAGFNTDYWTNLWEYNYARTLYMRPHELTGHMIPVISTVGNTLSNSPTDWLNIGFTTDPFGISYRCFLNNSFVANSTLLQSPESPTATLTSRCLFFGHRYSDNLFFNGTLRVLAFANATMSEAEIQQFFAAIP